jgi:uncharacterized protein YyaL (SSP411 family)
MNKLAGEKSPYLEQHAQNPVDWYPWGEEALAKARREEKPIFLSIGYSTCHWCHVMEHESFENQAIADVLNRNFVAIKVDREERPDLDDLYMTAVQGMTGQGGWPMSLFLTPDRKPFFAGTYFPPQQFLALLTNVAEAWKDHRGELSAQGDQVSKFLQERITRPGEGEGELTPALLDSAARTAEMSYDVSRGGFGSAPKFPTPHKLTFLLRYAARAKDKTALAMVRGTLDAMAAGGIHDHLGGGFHRYSTDANWLVPHFEKMLYDQAGLALAYTQASVVFRDPKYAVVVRDILDYVNRDLHHPEGGYYAAEDADSEGHEGTFYIWTAAEIDSILGSERGLAFRKAYQASDIGNWEGKNILHVTAFTQDGFERWRAERDLLFQKRALRPRPHRDEKILVAWNGYMIEAMAGAGASLGEARYIESAVQAATFIETHLWKDGRLLRHYRNGAAPIGAYLEDYAFLGRGYLALYEATFDPRWLEGAVRTAREMVRVFSRPDGMFAMAGADAESLLAPVVDTYDGAMPSGNSAAAVLLLRLGHLTGDRDMEERGHRLLDALRGDLTRAPDAHTELLSALDFYLGPKAEIVVAGDPEDPMVKNMWRAVREAYLPNAVLALRPPDARSIAPLIPYLEAQVALEGKPTAYVCQGYACRLPVHDAAALKKNLENL